MDKHTVLLGMIILLLPSAFLFGLPQRETSPIATDHVLPQSTQPEGILEESMRQAVNDFSFGMLASSATATGNILISPASIHMALSMTANGAAGTTETEMAKVLGGATGTVQDINRAGKFWNDALDISTERTEVSIANSIWLDNRFIPSPQFLQTNADWFGSEVKTLDFANPKAPATVNSWVKTHTKGLIDHIVDSMDPDSPMVLVNTVYFISDWRTPFEATSTRDRTFHSPDADIKTPFMNTMRNLQVFDFPVATGLVLPYVQEDLVFFALLPDEGTPVRTLLADLAGNDLMDSVKQGAQSNHYTFIDLYIPKFTIRYSDSLVDNLRTLGMLQAFNPGTADFSRMGSSGTKDLFIDEVLHKTYMRFDETGTEAAAVTAVMMKATAMPMRGDKLSFDRPFLYGIADLTTGLPLFLGIMDKPELE